MKTKFYSSFKSVRKKQKLWQILSLVNFKKKQELKQNTPNVFQNKVYKIFNQQFV